MKSIRISESEWIVMRELWKNSPQTALSVVTKVSPLTGWADKTVRTLLGRLVKKKALRFVRSGKEYLFEPAVREEACVAAESSTFLERIFSGSLVPMLAHFMETNRLTKEDIRKLREILDRVEGDMK